MIYFYLIFLSFTSISLKAEELDLIDKIILAHKSDRLKDFIYYFGDPESIDTKKYVPKHVYKFEDKASHRSFESFYDPKSGIVTSTVLIFWKTPRYSISGYHYFKKRFKDYRWIEKPKKSKLACVIQDLYDVKIPEVGMSFRADKYNPLIDFILFE